ncbi:MAG: hypothetical protein WBL27_03175 [Salinimicrobium sp.]
MRPLLVLLFVLFSTGLMAQEGPVTFAGEGISFSGDNNISTQNKELVELTGNVHFSTSIVEIEKADKIVYDKKTKTFTISGFKELRLNGKKKLASDLGPTTLKIDLGDCVAYLVANVKACDGKDC